MYSENGVLVDFDEVRKVIADADVFILGFANFPERVLVDARRNASETALVQVVDPARGGARERLAWLQRRRPTLGPPKSFTFLAWPHSPDFLVKSGIWDRIRNRVEVDSDPDVNTQCAVTLRQIENLDAAASMAVLKGERTFDLWPRQVEEDER